MKKKANMPKRQLAAILRRHAIEPRFWPEMHDLVYYGKRPGVALLRRLHNVGNYAACLHEILTVLSEPVLRKHKFPPRDWQPACSKAS